MMNELSSACALQSEPAKPSMDGVEANFAKVAVALNHHSKAVIDLREQVARARTDHVAAFDQISKNVNGLHDQLARMDRDGSGIFDRMASAISALRERLSKLDTHSASNFDLLSKTAAAAIERLGKLETEVAGMRPQVEAMKVHADSFPHALREARRSDTSVEAALKSFEARLQQLESRIAAPVRTMKG